MIDSSHTFFGYELGEFKEKGGEGAVFKGMVKESEESVALKVLTRPLSAQAQEVIDRLGHHPHIVDVVKVLEDVEMPSGHHTFKAAVLVMEWVEGGDLLSCLEELGGPLPEDHVKLLFSQLLMAMKHCHSRCVFHRDIKLENIMLSSDGTMLKVCDFGVAEINNQGWVRKSVGTPSYASPEAFEGGVFNGEKADVWSCGVVLFALLTGNMPFISPSRADFAFRCLMRGRVGDFWTYFERRGIRISEEAKRFLIRIFMINPVRRAGVDELLASDWLSEDKEEEQEQEQEG